ncbi:hypothetical protein [Mycobacteroides chelonae]|uniref:hypothetical protein n=1 Tax=Mycobacteroides chelonae TaxID=1774 RepID=UPI00222F0DB8|nr:hypothetical protein [Mycobacteroides chelonae]
MSDTPVTPATPVTDPAPAEPATPAVPAAPTPAVMPAQLFPDAPSAPAPAAPAAPAPAVEDDDDDEDEPPESTPKDLAAARKLRRENRRLRERAQNADADREGRLTAEAELARYRLATHYRINDPDDIELIGSGTPQEMEKRAQRIAALAATNAAVPPAQPTPPPSDRPVEGLKPGASPAPPKPEDTSYPASWGFHPQPRN